MGIPLHLHFSPASGGKGVNALFFILLYVYLVLFYVYFYLQFFIVLFILNPHLPLSGK